FGTLPLGQVLFSVSCPLACFRLPYAPGSRHLNSQTSGPYCRSARIKLPFCMDILSLRSSFDRRHNPSTNCVPAGTCTGDRRGEDARGYCFASEITWEDREVPATTFRVDDITGQSLLVLRVHGVCVLRRGSW